ncbi:MAG: tRNA guanosine(34) transglycosylase Tgt [Candidatus Pacebacteria bacterium]|nr:tRNA guanosine(34) transglycosylase Tgt [Candidatus Paceibacterota bacterium]
MLEFKVLKRSKKSRARLGVISTPHGDIETPAFVPVATRATVRTLDSEEVAEVGSQVLICNTYHLYVAPGEKIMKKAGGIHGFMNWDKPLMTDSGGFQVFSLGFGKDHGMGKALKDEQEKNLVEGSQPHALKITEEGVYFRSPLDGTPLFLGPKESIRIQQSLGADIMFAFDECPSPLANIEYMRTSVERTHRWAALCLKARTSKQALYGIVQGGAFSELRAHSAAQIGALPFDGFGIGGEFGYDKRSLKKVVGEVTDLLPADKPRHLLGVGHPEDFPYIASAGADTFDCIAPTHYARRGVAFTSSGRIDIRNRRFLTDQKPLDKTCTCDICKTYSRSYISHLMRAHELSGMKLMSYHNLHFLNAQAHELRRRIKNGDL